MGQSMPINPVSGAKSEMGHFEEFLHNPAHFLLRAYH